MSSFDDGASRSSPALLVAAIALAVIVAGTLWMLASSGGGGPVARHTAPSGGPDAVKAHRYDRHPDGRLAACEVTLSIRDVEIVRRGVFAPDGTCDVAASGLFRAGARERELTAVEVADLRTVGERGPEQHGKAYPPSLTAER